MSATAQRPPDPPEPPQSDEPITNAMKVDAVRGLLAEFDSILIYVLCTSPGVCLPDEVKAKGITVLEIGLNMPVPIPDLTISELGITCTLSFAREPRFVAVPWAAVGMVRVPEGSKPKGKPARKLSAVPVGAAFDATLQDAPTVAGPPTLRIVK